MLNVGPGEVLVILVIALVVLGPSRLPGTARALGRILARTRRIVTRFQQEMQAAADAPLEAFARERGRLEPPAASAGAATPSEPAAPAGAEAAPGTGAATTPDPAAPGAEPRPATPSADTASAQRDAR